ncbi:T9SS type A sorting domain-containing protein [Flavobacterium coralii]|uniref:T9SS type A sorting domain-containing protein n=1 Tax=Flavobacterium coralii TaxID=2838017 RepID=UPI000C4FF5A9|nr:hypothetical protein [Flavobacterium sp.]|tara:strand:+ start:3950 stop:6211 length:2262 start_codon:yes stop_codon:yes gene_type:complete
MRKQLLFLLLLVFAGLNAQIVTIPDAEFKGYLLAAQGKNSTGQTILINANQDNEIQVSEALAVWELVISTIDANSISGIEAFTNLHDLKIYNIYGVQQVNLTQLINLEKLSITSTGIDSLQINGLTNLKDLQILYSFEISETVNSQGLISLENIDFNGFEADFDFTQLPALKSAILQSTEIPTIDLTACEFLNYLDISNMGSIIDLGYKPLLTYCKIDLSLSGSSDVAVLDLSGCTAINTLFLSYAHTFNAPFRYLNLKNGISSYDSFNVIITDANYQPVYVCIDEGNENLLSGAVVNNPDIYISSYCDFMPGGDYNTITGNFTFDEDNNGCGAEDSHSNMVKINIYNGTENVSTFSDSNGNYNFYTEAGTFTLTPEFENDWFIATPSSASVTFTDDNNNINAQNFCITANGIHPDLEVVVASGGAQPGFDAYYTVTFKNKGNQQLSGTITLTYNDTVLDFISASNGGTDTAGTISWGYSNLQPFESRQLAAVLNVNSPMETPAINIDDILNFTATITPTAGDETPVDNTFTLNQVVTGSYDPNDITCLEGESVIPELIGEYLHYNINFENTGNAPATFIAVKNTLNPEQFDLSTLQLLYASHDVETRLSGNELEFYFGDINLAANGGKSNVVYKIKTNNTLQVNDDVAQQANIYFDYNWPIQTNEAVTTFETLSSGIHTKDNSIKLYPNPATGIVTITAATEIESVEMYDMQGRLLQVTQTSTVDITQRQSGIYFVKVTTKKGTNVQKLAKE